MNPHDVNQYQWTFLDNKRRRHTLGIAHGAESGHLVVHCDHRVTLIEFGVVEPRVFSFFVEDELCKLSIEGSKEEGFTYSFNIDTEVDTELNRNRSKEKKIRDRRNLVRSILLFMAPVLIIGALFAWGYNNFINDLPNRLAINGVRALATQGPSGDLQFLAFEEVISGQPLKFDRKQLEILDLQSGDIVPITFLANKPGYFIVDWKRAIRPFSQDSTGEGTLLTRIDDQLSNAFSPSQTSVRCVFSTLLDLRGETIMKRTLNSYLLGDQAGINSFEALRQEPAFLARMKGICPATKILPSDQR